jgi:D-lactate dehydrogenase
MARIVCFEVENWEQELFKQAFGDEVLCISEAYEKQHEPLLKDTEILGVFIYSVVTREVLNAAPNLKLVCTMSTGYDHIDLKACAERGITVCNVPTYGERTVAQHAFALLLALTRKLVPSVDEVRRGSFVPTPALRGHDIDGKTLGVIGTGKIGRNAIKIARGFNMNVVAYDPFPNNDLAQELGFTYLPLEDLYKQSDIVTIHVPLLPTTTHLINDAAINQMKRGVIIVNTSRGGIVETESLYRGLVSGQVGGAGLDVLEQETHVKEEKQLLSQQFRADIDYRTVVLNHLLILHPNAIVTPHNAFNSIEALTRIINTTIDNVKAFRSGQPQNAMH